MFFLMFFLFNSLRLEFPDSKDHSVPEVTSAEGIQKSASMKLQEWSKNVVSVENHQFLKV